ncbi:MAG: DUF948 domain-containing protein [Proteobacteria bacterium]|nr:DUF948 domain-containing protein [Pseudomonadota bacterium]MBU1738526.1 DUF948 domain-containing protein [Pseudomonadota bacterium]
MTLNEIFLIIAAAAIVLITAALVPLLIQLKRTVRKAETTMDSLDRQLNPLLITLNQTADELHTLTGSINKKLDDADFVIRTLRLAGESLLLTSNLFRKTVAPVITQVGGLSSGVRAFLTFLNLTSPKTRKEDNKDGQG